MNYYQKDQEFQRYASSEFGLGSNQLDAYSKHIESSMTPYILEERQLRATQLDIFSRLMMDRLLWVAGPVNDRMSTVVQAQLMFLDTTASDDITMHIDSPGGSVKSGLSMVDVMEYINADIRTINTGMAASMGSVLLGAGTKGKRMSLRHSTVMIHQSSGSFSGNVQDAEIDWKNWQQVNHELFVLLGSYCGKDPDVVKRDAVRDFWLTAEAAVEYGIVDEIIKKSKRK
jgi:ATP-dependent Clp protease protease subunit